MIRAEPIVRSRIVHRSETNRPPTSSLFSFVLPLTRVFRAFHWLVHGSSHTPQFELTFTTRFWSSRFLTAARRRPNDPLDRAVARPSLMFLGSDSLHTVLRSILGASRLANLYMIMLHVCLRFVEDVTRTLHPEDPQLRE